MGSTLVQSNKGSGGNPGSIYEPGWVIHPINCHEIGCTCTPLEVVEANEKIREQRLKEYRHTTPHNAKRRMKQVPTQPIRQSNPLEDF